MKKQSLTNLFNPLFQPNLKAGGLRLLANEYGVVMGEPNTVLFLLACFIGTQCFFTNIDLL